MASGNASRMTPLGRLEEGALLGVLGYQLVQAGIVTSALFDEYAGRPFGLRPVEYTVLALISGNPGVSSARLAKALAVSPPNISPVVERLEERGLITRAPSEEDRRAQTLHATRAGNRLVEQATRQVQDAEAALGLSPGEHAILLELLHKLARARTAS